MKTLTSSTDLSLTQRLEYLSRATMCAKSCPARGVASSSAAPEGEFLHELEEKMEVARLQMHIYEALGGWPASNPHVQEARARLNAELLDITAVSWGFANVALLICVQEKGLKVLDVLWSRC